MRLKKNRRAKRKTEYGVTLSYLVKNKMAVVGLIIVATIIVFAIFADYTAPYDPIEQNLEQRFSLPNAEHLLGTDEYGRDILSRIIYGSRYSLDVAILVTITSGVTGTLLGALAGYLGGKLDSLIMRLVDVVLAVPDLLLAIAIMAIIGPGIVNLILAMSVTYWTRWARLVRAEALTIREKDFVNAAKAFGAHDGRIIFSHILPNVMPMVIVLTTLTMAGAILYEAALSFIGLGVPPPAPSWGSMLAGGREYMSMAGHILIFPGIVITLTTLGLYMIGDGLRDALDPRLRID